MMRALQLNGSLEYRNDVSIPEADRDQALLKVIRAGICNTDLELVEGYMNFSGILGHEFVAEVQDGPSAWIGKRVVGEINVADGECEFCRQGIPSQCSNRVTLGIDRHNGAFADYMLLKQQNLHVVPDNVEDNAAVFVEPLAAALQVLEAVHVSPRDRVIVVGIGKLGALVAQVLRLTGADVVGLVRREKQARLLEKWGIAHAGREDLQDRSASLVVDCTGTSDGFATSLDLVKPRGTIVLKSTYTGIPQADLTRIAVDEVRVIGSRCGPFDAALRLLSASLVDVESLIEARYPIEQGMDAFDHAARKGVFKVLLDF